MAKFERSLVIERNKAGLKAVPEICDVIFAARNMLGGLFKREDYPEASEIRDKFAFRTVITPVSEVEDFRVNLAADEVASIQRGIEARPLLCVGCNHGQVI